MCGIAGLIDLNDSGVAEQVPHLIRARDRLRTRGPDAAGEWHDAHAALGHRRLSILDLSENGFQPMHSKDERYAIVFNGEIYNFQELRDDLEKEGLRFTSGSDTEVLLEGYARWGHERLLSRLNGMFAFAIWDKRERELFLARDRFGVKPLAFAHSGRKLAFASTLDALREFPFVSREIDPSAVSYYLQALCVPSDTAIYRGVRKLPAGSWLRMRRDGSTESGRFWAPPPRNGTASRSRTRLLDEFDELLRAAVRRRLVADVPVGVFLSGGIDSSLIARYASMEKPNIETFTISFPGTEHDESLVAREVARTFGTRHHEEPMDPSKALKVLPKIGESYDEPFADASAIPMLLLSDVTRKRVTVALAGDGGDELFAGYYYHRWIRNFARAFRALPPPLRKAAAAARAPGAPYRLRLIQEALSKESLPEVYLYMRSPLKEIRLEDVLEASPAPRLGEFLNPFFGSRDSSDPRTYCEYDFHHYLQDDLLVKGDRASMAWSLEVRCPFLDFKLVEWIYQVPFEERMRGGLTKSLSRDLLAKHLPASITGLPKKGFTVPIREWFRGPLAAEIGSLPEFRGWSELGVRGPGVKRLVQEHQLGARNHESILWALWVLKLWKEQRSA